MDIFVAEILDDGKRSDYHWTIRKLDTGQYLLICYSEIDLPNGTTDAKRWVITTNQFKELYQEFTTYPEKYKPINPVEPRSYLMSTGFWSEPNVDDLSSVILLSSKGLSSPCGFILGAVEPQTDGTTKIDLELGTHEEN